MTTTPATNPSASPNTSVTHPRPRSKVEVAFALGWHVAVLYHLRDTPSPPSDPVSAASLTPDAASGGANSSTTPQPDGRSGSAGEPIPTGPALADLTALSFPERADILKRQIGAGAVALLGNGRPDPAAHIVIDTSAGELGRQSRADLMVAHRSLLQSLAVADSSLGKAYSLGTQIAEMCLVPYLASQTTQDATMHALKDMFTDDRIGRLKRQLWDLKSAFQPYATDAVGATLLDWGKWINEKFNSGPSTYFRLTRRGNADWKWASHLLYRQSGSWRALLFGEEIATDTLQVSDYVASAAHIASRFLRLVRSTIWRWKIGFLLAIVFGVLIAAGSGYAVNAFGSHLAGASTALVALLGAFGLTGATIVAAVKTAVSRLEQGLLDAELAAAVALAINLVPGGTKDVSDSAVDALHNGSNRNTPTGPPEPVRTQPARQISSSQ